MKNSRAAPATNPDVGVYLAERGRRRLSAGDTPPPRFRPPVRLLRNALRSRRRKNGEARWSAIRSYN
jgi:hypothetical protein